MGSNALRKPSPALSNRQHTDEGVDRVDHTVPPPSRQRKIGIARPPPTIIKNKANSLEEIPLKEPFIDDDALLLPVAPPDGGFGWVIVFASFMNHIIVDGIAFTFGIFLPDFLVYFEAGSGRTALVGSLMNAFYLLTAPFAGLLVNRFGCRRVSMVGAVIAALGFSLCTLSPNIEMLMVTYGVMGGFGLGILYLPNIVAVSYYFEKRRAMATGIAVCGAGVGCFMFAPLAGWLLQAYHWKYAMLVFAGIALNGAVFGALLRPVEELRRPRSRHPSGKKTKLDRIKEKLKPAEDPHRDWEKQQKKMEKVIEIKLAREDALNAGGSTSDLAYNVLGRKRNSRSVPAVTQEPILSLVRAGRVPEKCNSELCMVPAITGSDGYLAPVRRRDLAIGGSTLALTPAHSLARLNRSMVQLPQGSGSESIVHQSGQLALKAAPTAKKSLKERFKEEYVGLLTDPKFIVPCVANLFAALGLFIPFVYLVKTAMKLGISDTRASFLLSVIGITNTLGRILAGFLADFEFINSLALHNSALILAGVSSMLITFYTTYPILCIYAAFFGICIATWISLTSIVLCDILGLSMLTNAFSILTMTRGVATLLGSPLAGWLFDTTNSYDVIFYLCGVSMLCGGLLLCLLHLPYFKPRNQLEHIEANKVTNIDELPVPPKMEMLQEIEEKESPK